MQNEEPADVEVIFQTFKSIIGQRQSVMKRGRLLSRQQFPSPTTPRVLRSLLLQTPGCRASGRGALPCLPKQCRPEVLSGEEFAHISFPFTELGCFSLLSFVSPLYIPVTRMWFANIYPSLWLISLFL